MIVYAVADGEFALKLTRDQALVLSDWLYRVMGTATFAGVVNEDRAAWLPLWTGTGIPASFSSSYGRYR